MAEQSVTVVESGNGRYGQFITAGHHVLAADEPQTVGGVVLRVRSESETVVGAGTPLVEIGNPHALEIVVELPSRDAIRVRQGAKGNHRRLGRRSTERFGAAH